jgi:hypothetical protein
MINNFLCFSGQQKSDLVEFLKSLLQSGQEETTE